MTMMIDADRDYEVLSQTNNGAMPRKSLYGSAPGLAPLGDMADKLVSPSDYKEVIADCHRDRTFAYYHQRETWLPPQTRWNQSTLKYCWTWGSTAALMDLQAAEGKAVEPLSPVSLGWAVGWSNRGNYLESAIAGLRERGVCRQKFTPKIHSRNHRAYLDGWEADAANNRLDEVWDCDNTRYDRMIQHAVTGLAVGGPGYCAYDWWGHALELVALEWDESVLWNTVWVLRNSHNEADVIRLHGRRAVPSELYIFRSTVTNTRRPS